MIHQNIVMFYNIVHCICIINHYVIKPFQVQIIEKHGLYLMIGDTILQVISDTFITWTNLENDPIVGFSIMYFLAKLIPFLLFLLWILPSCLTSLKGKRVR